MRGNTKPRSGMAKAINYLIKNFRELGRFLRFASIPPDNNVAETSLRLRHVETSAPALPF